MSETLRYNNFGFLNDNELYAINGGDALLAGICLVATAALIVVTIACPPVAPVTGAVAGKCIGIAITGTLAAGGAYFL